MHEVSKETFDQEVTQSGVPVVADFWGPQCGPCLALMPEVEAFEKKFGDRVKLVKVEAPKNRRLCISLKVLSLPTFLFYREGQEVNRLTGDISIESIEEEINKIIE